MVKPEEAPVDEQTLRKALHASIEQLSGKSLVLVNRIILQLEAEALAQALDAGFDDDRKAGKLGDERIQRILAEFRAAHKYR